MGSAAARKLLTAAAATLSAAACTVIEPDLRAARGGETDPAGLTQGAAGAVGALEGTSSGKRVARNAMLGSGLHALSQDAISAYMDLQESELRRLLERGGVAVRRIGDEIHLVMPGDVTFPSAESTVSEAFLPVLDDVAAALNDYDRSFVEVSGHTDRVGPRDYNRDLSQKRANSVAAHLIERDVFSRRIIVQAFGEELPLVPTVDGVDEPRNRRVEIRISPLV